MKLLRNIAGLLISFSVFISNAEAFNTMVEYENKTRDGGSWFSHIDNCFSSGKAMFQLSVGDFNNSSIPHYIKRHNTVDHSSRAGWPELLTFGRAIIYMDMLMSFSPASLIALVAIGTEYLFMLDICTNTFIVAPHEYANLAIGNTCSPKNTNGNVKWVAGKSGQQVLTAVDVPFFYHCDPKYDPDKGGQLVEKDNNYKEKLDNTYGYMGEASPYCTNGYGKMVTASPTQSNEFPIPPWVVIGSQATAALNKLEGDATNAVVDSVNAVGSVATASVSDNASDALNNLNQAGDSAKRVGQDLANTPSDALDTLAAMTGIGTDKSSLRDPKTLIGRVLFYQTPMFSRIYDFPSIEGEGAAAILRPMLDIVALIIGGLRDQHDSCTFQPYGTLHVTGGEDAKIGFYQWIAYYKFDNKDGKVKLCVAAPFTLFPVTIGCSYVPPPVYVEEVPSFSAAEGTRCEYFQGGRSDLKKLGLHISKQGADDSNGNKKAVVNFLISDMHITSTVVGCILDLLDKIFIPHDSGSVSVFQDIQANLKNLVLVCLTLYVCLVAIKIMSSGGNLQKKDYIMFILKFALVAYFTLGNAWFGFDKNGNRVGIYYGLLDGSQQIASFFMGAQNLGDPLGHCRYDYDGGQVLSQRNIPVQSGMEATIGGGSGVISGNDIAMGDSYGSSGHVIMTVWDLLDCRLMSYLNFGTCNFNLEGLIAIWSITSLILVSGIGFLLFIVMFIYSYMLLKVIFKFTHIFILSMFVITILVILSPIMIVFSLFTFTKSIFEQWFNMLVGYVIYPGLHFAFIALMLATFDNIYFNDLNFTSSDKTLFEQCTGLETKTPICAIAKHVEKNASTSVSSHTADSIKDMCDMNIGSIIHGLYESEDLFLLGIFSRMTKDVANALYHTIPQLALMSFLFYMLMGTISSFFSILCGVQDLSGMAKGDLSGQFAGAVGMGAKAPFKLLGNLVKGAVKSGGKGGGDKGGNKDGGKAARPGAGGK
jgi:type IV secretory pathway VirB6-like protein